MKTSFRDRLAEERPILFDGGMGTELVARGQSPGAATNVTIPEVIREIQRAYVDAGAEVILTNTFSANAPALSRGGEAERLAEYVAAACRVAHEAAGEAAWVAGDIGPTGDFLEPVGSMTEEAMRDAFEESARCLREGGVDLFVVETMSDDRELTLAVQACRKVGGGAPVIASMSFDPVREEYRTNTGLTPSAAACAMQDSGADVMGANCGSVSPEQMAEIVRQLKKYVGRPVLIQANAGLPQLRDGRTVYDLAPEAFAAGMLKTIAAGARLVGGCCGTTPAHIKALAAALRKKG
jgi:5-methyltetrahydrofolate--homocysteine methyltransferase